MTANIRVMIIVVFIAVMAAIPAVLGDFSVTLLNYIGIYTLVALGLVLLTGCGGLTSFGQAAFVGIGAYSTAYLSTSLGWSPWLGLLAALTLTALVALVIGFITLHLGGHYLPITTIAWGMAIYLLFGNFEFLGRYGGLSNIPPVSLFGYRFEQMTQTYYLVWCIVGLCLLLATNLLRSRQGRAIRALRGGIVLAESLGISTFQIRLTVFVLAAVLAGLAGWLYAHVQKFVSPAPFDLRAGIEYLLMAVLGGSGHVSGALIGAAAVALSKDWLQDILPHVTTNSGNLEIVVFGCLFILLLQYSRGGIVPALLPYLPRVHRPVPLLSAQTNRLPERQMPPIGQRLLQLNGVSKSFGGLIAVDNVSFAVSAGELVALIGPNGAGKTTTFNLITGILPPSAGTIAFSGHDLTGKSARYAVSAGISRTFQHVKLRPAMSVLENVKLGTYSRSSAGLMSGALRLDRSEENSIEASALFQIDRVGLIEQALALAGNLALGQQRLVEIARALAANPTMLMLDEPAAGLRSREKAALANLLKTLRQGGMTILLVEHDMDFVMGLADRIVVLDFGKKLAEGVPNDIRRNAAVQEAYLGGVS
jgi:branched-chain amino acid transport system permease protein